MNTYIKGNLWALAEFEFPINCIMVEIRSSFIHPTTTNLHCRYLDSPPTTRNRTEVSPSPLLSDVGSNQTISTHSEIRTHCICPSPFQRDVGSSSSLNEGFGEREAQGGTQGVGGPYSEPQQWIMMNVVVHFPFPHSFHLTDISAYKCLSYWRDVCLSWWIQGFWKCRSQPNDLKIHDD